MDGGLYDYHALDGTLGHVHTIWNFMSWAEHVDCMCSGGILLLNTTKLQ